MNVHKSFYGKMMVSYEFNFKIQPFPFFQEILFANKIDQDMAIQQNTAITNFYSFSGKILI